VYAQYRDAASDLQDRLGDYCSYCERRIETHLAVEHIQPKSLVPALRNTWSNFLLGCVHCDSSKGDAPITLFDYLWPDSDNTLRAVEYIGGGMLQPNQALSVVLRGKAQAMIELMGLDRDPGNPRVDHRPSDSDRRWLRRVEAWQLAERAKRLLAINKTRYSKGRRWAARVG
jgi:uncharacterized protein (TIGR02646 family)